MAGTQVAATKHIVLPVRGMSCAACVAHVEKAGSTETCGLPGRYRLSPCWALAQANVGIAIGSSTDVASNAAGLIYPWTGRIVSPQLAALFMALSSFSVTMNTLMLKGFVPSMKKRRYKHHHAGDYPLGEEKL